MNEFTRFKQELFPVKENLSIKKSIDFKNWARQKYEEDTTNFERSIEILEKLELLDKKLESASEVLVISFL